MEMGVPRGGVFAGDGVAGAGGAGFAGVGVGAPGEGVPGGGAGAGVPGFGVLATGVAALGVLGVGVGVAGAGVTGLAGEGVCAVPESAARSDVVKPKSAIIATAALVCFLKKGIIGMMLCEWGCLGDFAGARFWAGVVVDHSLSRRPKA